MQNLTFVAATWLLRQPGPYFKIPVNQFCLVLGYDYWLRIDIFPN